MFSKVSYHKSFLNIRHQNIFFMRRLLNKPVKKESNIQHSYDEESYLKAMKEFQKRTRGLIPGSKEYDEIRNQIYANLRKQKVKDAGSSSIQSVQTTDFSSFYILLIVVPEKVECYETVNILNYFNFPFNLEEDNILRPVIKKEMGFHKEDEYPLLLIDSSSPEIPNAEATEMSNILNLLKDNSLIGDYKTHSAYETQGLSFVDSEITPVFDDLFSDFRQLFQFYFTPKNFRKASIRTEVSAFFFSYLWRFYKIPYQYRQQSELRTRKAKKEKYESIQQALDKFIERFAQNKFHGGDRVDAVDFKVYSYIQKYMHTSTMKRLMMVRGKQDKLSIWYDRMERECNNRIFM